MSTPIAVQQDTANAWTALEASPEWSALSPKQKMFVVIYAATGNQIAATNAGYSTQSVKTAQVFSYELLKHPKISAALKIVLDAAELSVFDDAQRTKHRTPRQRMLNQLKRTLVTVDKHLAAAEPGSTAAQRLLSERRSLLLDIGEIISPELIGAKSVAPAETFEIGNCVRQNGLLYQVTAVDAAGKITAATEVKE